MNEMVIVKDLASKPHLLTLDQIKAIISNDHILSSKLGVDTDTFMRFHSYKWANNFAH